MREHYTARARISELEAALQQVVKLLPSGSEHD